MATRTRYIVGFTVLSVLAAFLLPAMPQPVAYHDFADHREMLGVANFLDVASNVAFVLAGLAGLAVVLRPRTVFASNAERWPYAVFFAGMVLTGLGSAYYHLVPDNERLFWDRLPMTIAFMSLIAAQVVDRIDARTGLALLVPMLLVGAASVLYWRATERAGAGNVMPYAVLQGYSVVILFLLALLQPSRYTRGNDIYWVFAGYVLAKLLETFDRQLLSTRPRGQRPHAQAPRRRRRRPGGLPHAVAAQPAAAFRGRTPQRRRALMVRPSPVLRSRQRAVHLAPRFSCGAMSCSRKKLTNARIAAMAASCPISSQLGAKEVWMMSAASWKVSPAISQRAY